MTQPTLFDTPVGTWRAVDPESFSSIISQQNKAEETASEAIERAGEHADQEWKQKAMSIIFTLCLTNPSVSADEIWEALESQEESTKEPRALGALLRHAARNGWCRLSGTYRPSKLQRQHHRPIPVWDSLIYRPY